jgi:TolB protein
MKPFMNSDHPRLRLAAFVALALVAFSPVVAQDIRIVGTATDAKIPLSIRELTGGGTAAEKQFLDVLRADLVRSGWFTVSDAAPVVVLRGTSRAAGSSLEVRCEVLNRATGKSYFSRVYREEAARAPVAAHALADAIVEAVKGVRGIASTRIAMIGSREGRKDLYVSGSDGQDLVQLTRDGVPCLSPAWTPDARGLFYTSFVRGFPDVYRIDLDSGRRTRAVAFPGMNTGAQVSPDGRFLALVLSKDGNPEIYTQELASGKLTRITRTEHAAEASPAWSPDGRQLAFVSDSTGAPQIYIIGREGGKPQRLTFQGNENVSPSWGPDGRLAYSSRRLGRYQICVYDPRTKQDRQITSAAADHENPSWAPNARHIVYSRTEGYAASIYILDTMGDPQIKLTALKGDWYFPVWSPR